MSQHKVPTILVTGASGQLGHRIVELLLEAKAGTIVAATRTPSKLADLAAKGAVVRAADFDDPASLPAAFAGVDRVVLVSTDALDAPGKRLAQHRNAIAAAAKAGVSHIAYTSLTNPAEGSPMSLADDHRKSEEAIRAAGLSGTFLRNALYTDLLLGTVPRAIASGQLVSAAPKNGAAYVTREDCARIAAAAIQRPAGLGVIDVTGPAVLTNDEVAAIASELSGKPVAHVAIPADALRAGLAQAGLPTGLVEAIVTFDVAKGEGLLAITSGAVRELTGRAPTSVRNFLAAHRAALGA